MKLPLIACAMFASLFLAAAELGLPDPLTAQDGSKVTTAEQWRTKRRGEVLELFRENIYGRMPVGRPANLKFEVTETNRDAMEGKATLKLVKISFGGNGREGAIRLVLFTPNKRQEPAPCFLLINNRSVTNMDATRAVKSPFWPAEEIIARGYVAAAFHNADVAADKKESWQGGVHAMFDPASGRASNAWGTIAAWAWGASRVMDYLESDPDIDARRVAVVGHSRGGKTALWAGAEDERFAMAVSNDSGSTGAAIARAKQGEQIADINRSFPHWFCDNYKRFNGRTEELPVDQHMLLALLAPRPVYVASASEDTWADPHNEFLATVHATPVYRLVGGPGMNTTNFPAADTPLLAGRIGYHVRTGKHDLTPYDWRRFMDFADRHLTGERRRAK